MNQELITVMIADDHEFIRGGVMAILNKSADIKVVAEASDGEQAVQLAEKYLPDVILMDIQMPGMNGIEATRIITKKMPSIGVIALSMMDSSYMIAEMMHSGANGYLFKDASKEEVIEGIRAVSRNRDFFCRRASEKVKAVLSPVNEADSPKRSLKSLLFSEREKQITRLLCLGLTSAQISKKIFLSRSTIDNYRARLLQKTGCKNIAEFVSFVSKNNLFNT
jgi:DNA-binding NarL/FixJ family response regulator